MAKKAMVALTASLIAGLALAACFVVARPVPVGVEVYGPPVEYGYQPMLYNGYVVYYTDDGIPFYWSGGLQFFLPIHLRTRYIDHWRMHHGAYVNWYRHRGHQYRTRHFQHQGRPIRSDKPTLVPRKKGEKPTLKPKEKDQDDRPTLRPRH